MAIEGVSGGIANNESYFPKPKVVTGTTQETIIPNIKITEMNTTAKASAGNQSSDNSRANEQNDKAVTDKQIDETISKINRELNDHFTRAEFTYHKETKRISVKVIDQATDEVIREIPSEQTLEALEMMQRMWKLAGLFVDEKR